ncbi:hypothetical protein KY290_000283 [Solanum tuberosum]|uniref:Pentatricopeptide repeat-containing protein n=1 Tax=Solanum tuberosum TaxID=4113 RepID=A0ABQ7WIW3_SOLTU|nr:hypothetical protein KY290_000283 [Solanum tuberosum]
MALIPCRRQVLSACASTKLVNFGFQLVESVSCEFGLVAKMEHYGFMKKMPFEADATVLGDLMGACRLHGAIELGNGVAQLLLKSRPNHSRRYVHSQEFMLAQRGGIMPLP